MSPSTQVDRLKKLYELSMMLSGDPMEIFVHVANMIGELMAVKVVCLSEIRGTELHFLSVYVQGRIMVNAGQCPLDITPCATVEASKDLRIYDRVAERFPKAEFLRDHEADAYCGFPSLDNDGNVVAVTCLLDDKPRRFTPEDQELLWIAGQRIGAEIVRKRSLDQRQSTLLALQQSEERLRDVLEAAGHFIWEVDRHGRFTYLTEGIATVFGYEAETLLGRSLFELQFDGEIDGDPGYFFSAVRHRRRFRDLELRIRRGTERIMWVSASGTPLFDKQGHYLGFRGLAADITERKQAALALSQSEERLDLALRGAELGLWDWDIQTGQVYFNDRWISMLGYSRDELAPEYAQWARLVHPDDMPTVQQILDNHIAGNLPYFQVEHRLMTKEGNWKWVLSSGKVLEFGADRTPVRAAGTHLDISARKALEERLRQKQATLAHAQRLTTAGELAATIVHELNQPLGAMASYIGAANIEFKDLLTAHPRLQLTFDELSRLTQRASTVAHSIRDLVRRQDCNPQWVDLHALLTDVLTFMRGEFARRHVRLINHLSAVPLQIWGNPIQLQQMILNLIINALDAMDQNATSRRLTVRTVAKSVRSAKLLISDTGPGIAPEIMSKLFQPFVTNKPNGMGLGLPLCRTIAEAHGGSICARSEDGKGAFFEITLPTGNGISTDDRDA